MPTSETISNPMRRGSAALRFNLLLALVVWAAWWMFGGRYALHQFVANWKVALTVVFGAFVSGGTNEGGGAVAFPIFTKVLHIAPRDFVRVHA